MKASVCTIARGRKRHLNNLIVSLTRQTVQPAELVIGCMQKQAYDDLPETDFTIRQIMVRGERLPLSRARNHAAGVASGDLLIFLDVDCMAGPDLVSSFVESAQFGGCVMGDVRYLAEDDLADDDATAFERLWRKGSQHPARDFRARYSNGVGYIEDVGEFWSLCFALLRDRFLASGGFDEIFEGYGGEDTDFARTLARANIPLFWNGRAKAVHQWHAVRIPPIHHLEDIVRNANIFHAKHGRWCMEYWLDQFEQSGFIRRGTIVEAVRQPSDEDLARSVQDGSVRFS